jgi:hypothetical protein
MIFIAPKVLASGCDRNFSFPLKRVEDFKRGKTLAPLGCYANICLPHACGHNIEVQNKPSKQHDTLTAETIPSRAFQRQEHSNSVRPMSSESESEPLSLDDNWKRGRRKQTRKG